MTPPRQPLHRPSPSAALASWGKWLIAAGLIVLLLIGLAFSLFALHGCEKRAPAAPEDPRPAVADPVAAPAVKKEERPAEAGSPVRAFALAVSRNGKVLAAVGANGRVHFWSLADGKPLADLAETPTEGIGALALSDDSTLLACGSGKDILLFSLPDGKRLHTYTGHTQEPRSLAFTPDGAILVSGGADGFLNLWSVPERKLLKTLANLYSSVNALAITPNGELLVSGSGFLKGDLRLWSLPGGEAVKSLPGNERSVTALAMSPDGTLLASSATGKVRLWSLPAGKQVAVIDDQTELDATEMAFLMEGKKLACASSDGLIRLWSVADRKAAGFHLGACPPDRDRGWWPTAQLAVVPGRPETLVFTDRYRRVRVWDVKKDFTQSRGLTALAPAKAEGKRTEKPQPR
jgi:WD40 repeat protein